MLQTTFPADMIFTKYDTFTSDEQVEKLTRKLKIHYRACIGSLIYLLSTRVELSFAVHKLAKFQANPGKVYFEVLVHLLRYIRYNKSLGLKYYADMNDAPVSELLRKAIIKTENNLMNFSDYSWQDFPYTGRIAGEYNIFYQGGTIEHCTHVPGRVAQSSEEGEYNTACTAVMVLAHFRMLFHELFNDNPDIVPEESALIFLYTNSAVCKAKNGNNTKQTKTLQIECIS